MEWVVVGVERKLLREEEAGEKKRDGWIFGASGYEKDAKPIPKH